VGDPAPLPPALERTTTEPRPLELGS
jgi:hypothetical protein